MSAHLPVCTCGRSQCATHKVKRSVQEKSCVPQSSHEERQKVLRMRLGRVSVGKQLRAIALHAEREQQNKRQPGGGSWGSPFVSHW